MTMYRRPWLWVLLSLSLSLSACDSENTAPTPTSDEGASPSADRDEGHRPAIEGRDITSITKDLHHSLLTVDTHVDIPDTFTQEGADPGQNGKYQVDLMKMKEGNLNAVFFVVYVGQTERTDEAYAAAVAKARNKFDAIHRMTDELYSDKIELALSANDVRRIHDAGKLVALIGVENGFAFGNDLSNVEEYYKRGMRYAGFAHIGHSNFADSSWPREDLGDGLEEHGGLSDLGRALLAELNRLGVMADVSHSSKATTLEVARLSTAPVLASHSGAFGLYDHVRNLSDEELMAIKATGGVVQIVAFDSYVKAAPEEKAKAIAALRVKHNFSRATRSSLTPERIAAYRADVKVVHENWPRSSLSDFADHIDYAVKLIGIDHVGIASDFDGGGGIEGWMDASQTPSVTMELISRGYSVEEIRKLWGGNLLRVMDKVAAVSGKP
jgi:membrane dipeptidase